MADMLKVGFEKIPLDKVRKNANILVGSRYRIITVHSNYETVNFSDIATLTRGVTIRNNNRQHSEPLMLFCPQTILPCKDS